jgi:hypothetical protein
VALFFVGSSHPVASTSAVSLQVEISAAAEVCAGQLSVGIGTGTGGEGPDLLLGTGGTDLVKLLRGGRDRTSEAVFQLIVAHHDTDVYERGSFIDLCFTSY